MGSGQPIRMKAAVCDRSGPPEVVQIREVPRPVPKDTEVLVRVHASTICAADYRLRSLGRVLGAILGVRNGKILGMEFSGTVEAAGKAVTRFKPGDEVFGGTGFKLGTHAEYVCAPEKHVERKPSNMTLDEAAAVMFGGLTALGFLRKAGVGPGQNVLVYGASGSVGVFAVQLAKHFGARVTAVCSTRNLELVKSLGADEVIDYTKQDFASAGPVYDVIFESVGKAGLSRCLKAIKRGHPLILIAPSGGIPSILLDIFPQLWAGMRGAAKMTGGVAKPHDGDLAFLRGLIEEGKLRTVIDRSYNPEQIVEAHRYAEAGHKRGHVLIQWEQPAR